MPNVGIFTSDCLSSLFATRHPCILMCVLFVGRKKAGDTPLSHTISASLTIYSNGAAIFLLHYVSVGGSYPYVGASFHFDFITLYAHVIVGMYRRRLGLYLNLFAFRRHGAFGCHRDIRAVRIDVNAFRFGLVM